MDGPMKSGVNDERVIRVPKIGPQTDT
jgi:hypothetical protein